jgi:lysophospholipase L1-like esterase
VRRTALEWTAGTRLLAQGPDGHNRSLMVVGDSHAVLLVEGTMPSRRVVHVGPATTLVYLGPRLMHSVARDGLPTWALRLLAAWRRSPLARGGPTVALLLGEIDLRCHLAKPGRADPDALEGLVDTFLLRARDLLERLGPDGHVVVCGPNPPSSTYESDEAFPVVGDVDERIAILDRLCATISAGVEAANDPRLRFLDVRPIVAGPDGHLREDLTFDGCHLNATGAALVRARLAELDAG